MKTKLRVMMKSGNSFTIKCKNWKLTKDRKTQELTEKGKVKHRLRLPVTKTKFVFTTTPDQLRQQVSDAVEAWVEKNLARQSDEVEALLCEAIAQYDYGHRMMDRLHVVYQEGCAPAVASLVNLDQQAEM